MTSGGVLPRMLLCSLLTIVAGCSGGGGSGGSASSGCQTNCGSAPTALTVADIQNVLAQAVAEAQSRSGAATIAVVDRVGNVLAVFRMSGAAQQVRIEGRVGVVGGLEQIGVIPDSLVAISKALTGAYLSSGGNAFSTRTASQIVQEHFNPGELNTPSGPLYGVQFSQLPCSDISTRASQGSAGPHRSPLGLSADPGGFPLYRDGVVIGGVGVISDGVYGFDADIADHDDDQDEAIALAATRGLDAPADRRANHITADGKTLRYSDIETSQLRSSALSGAPMPDASGDLVSVPGYSDGQLHAGIASDDPASGLRADTTHFPGQDVLVLANSAGTPRYPPQAGSDGVNALSATETTTILQQAVQVAAHARAQIRQPLNSVAHVSIAVVDTTGTLLGLVQQRDAPLFGVDVSVQKARSALLFSSAQIDAIHGLPAAHYVNADASAVIADSAPGDYIDGMSAFIGQAVDGSIAFSARSLGNLARPYYPDGIQGPAHGPLSPGFDGWSIFNDGLQLDLSYNAIIGHVAYVLGNGAGADIASNCSGLPALANGLQIFPGGLPIYRGDTLVGAIGVSGDGVDQDDMTAFLGLDGAARQLANGLGNAPAAIRSDTLSPQGLRLRYVQCPVAPFVDSDDQDVCDGK